MSNVSRYFRALLCLVLSISIVLTMNPALSAAVQINSYDYQSQGLERPDLISYSIARSKGHVRRMPEMENEHTFVFQNIDGTLTSYTYEQAVQSRGKDGKLREIDLDILTDKDEQGKTSGYTINGNNHRIDLPLAIGGENRISIESGLYTLSFLPLDEQGSKQAGAPGQPGRIRDYNGKLTYGNAFGHDTTLEISTTLAGIKEDIILKKAPSSHVFRYEIDAPGLKAKVSPTGVVEFYDPATLAVICYIPEPFAVDAFRGKRMEGDGHDTDNIKVSIEQAQDGTWIYSLAVDPEFLYSPRTVYPVTIDPTVVISACSDHKNTYAASGYPSYNYYNGVKMYVGKDSDLLVCRGFMNFDLTGFTSNDAYMVTSALYTTEETLGYTSTCYVRVFRVEEAWTSPTLNWSNQPDFDTSVIIDSELVNAAKSYTFDITALVENWYLNFKGAGGYAQNGFALVSDREGSIVLRKFRASESSVNPPYLTINYTLVDRTAPNPPTGLTTSYIKNASYNGTAQLKASWTAATDLPSVNGSGIKNYEVVIKNSSGTVVASNANVTTTSWTTSTYHPDNATYTFYVRSVDNAKEVNGTGIYNESADATASLAVPDCEKPTVSSLTVTPSSWTNASSVTLGWTVVEPVGLSKLEYWFTSPVTTITSPALTGSTSINVSGLSNGTYTLNVKFTDSQNNAVSTTKTVYIDRSAPTAPSGLASTGKTATSVSLSWSVPTDNVGVTGYKIYKDGVFAADVTGTSGTVSGLTNGVLYTFTVKARDAAGNLSAASNAIQVRTTDTTPPNAPTSLTCTGKTGTTVSLSWTASTDNVGVTGYRIYCNGVEKGTSSTTSFSVTGLTNGTAYTFTVKAYDADGNLSAASSALPVTTNDTTPPNAPANLACTGKTGTSVSLSWTAPTDNVGVTGYRIYCAGVEKGTSTTTSFTVTGLDDGVDYTFTVKAYDAANNLSAASNALPVQTDDTTAPSVPGGLTLVEKTGSTVSVSWTPSTDNVGVSGYIVYCDGVSAGVTSGTSLTVTGLDDATAYTFTIKASDSASNLSDMSSGLQVTTDDTTPPDVPADLACTAKTGTSISLSWTAPNDNVGVTGYRVYNGTSLAGSTAGTSFIAENLISGTQYHFTVVAFDAADNTSEAGDILTVTTTQRSSGILPLSQSADISVVGGTSFADLQTGNLNYCVDDIILPEWQFDIRVTRHYNSKTNASTLMGSGWGLGLNLYFLEEFASVGATIPQTVTFRDQNGTYWSFTVETENSSVTAYVSPLGCPYSLEKVEGLYRMTDSSGIIYDFNSNLQLQTVLDQPFMMETPETVTIDNVEVTRVKEVVLQDRRGSLAWTFTAGYDGSGTFTGLMPETGCLFTMALVSGEYVLTEVQNGSMTYSFETNDGDDHGQVLDMTTQITSGSIIDQAKLTFTYNASYLLTGVCDGEGHAISIDYTDGLVTQITDQEDRQLLYSYADSQLTLVRRLDHFTDPVAKTGPVYAETLYTYDVNGFLSGICDPDNVTSELTFDSQGRLTSHTSLHSDSTDPQTQTRTMWREVTLIDYSSGSTAVRRQIRQYEREAQATEDTLLQTVRLGKAVYTVSSSMDLISGIAVYPKPTLITGEDGQDESDYSYGANPLRTVAITYADTEEDGLLDTVTRATSDFDSATPNLSEESAVMAGSAAFYPAFVSGEEESDTTLYDLAGRVCAVCPDIENHGTEGHVCDQYTFTPAGRTLTELTRKGLETSYEYDSSGRVCRTVHPDGHVSVSSFDFISDPQSPFTEDYFLELETDYGLNYFLERHLDTLKQTVYEEIRNCGDWLSLEYSYNGLGQKDSQTDKNGNVTSCTYYANGQVNTETIDQVLGPDLVTSYTYDEDDRPLTETDPYGNVTTFAYDSENDNRLLSKSTVVNGKLTKDVYDYSTLEASHCYTLTTTSYDGPSTADDVITATVTQMTEDDQATSVSKAVSGLVGGSVIQNTYSYDEDGQLWKIGHNGFSYVFTRDEDGTITAISVSDGMNSQVLLEKTHTDNEDGGTTDTDSYANGQGVTVITDKLGRTEKIRYNDGSTTVDRYVYGYSSEDTSGNDLDGEEITTIDDYSSGRETVSAKSDDEDSFNQEFVVTDMGTLAQLYAQSVVNTEDGITLTTNIASSQQAYVYSKDTSGRLFQAGYTLPDDTAVVKTDSYGNYGEATGSILNVDSVARLQKSYAYRTVSGVSFSGQVETETIQQGGTAVSYGYQYDGLGNITRITKTEGGSTTDVYRYVYDEAGQLIREDNAVTSLTTTWQYDVGGNIRTRKVYSLTAENTTPDEGDLIDTIPYTYSTGIWKDLLTSYDEQSIVYDASGNPTSYLGATLAWTMGRQLASYSKTGLSGQYTYNQDGIRTSKTVNGIRTDYYLNGMQVIAEVTGGSRIDYRYDGYGNLVALRWDGDEYYVVTNMQGDVIGLIDGSGTSVVQYTYDAWGNQTSCTGTLANTLGLENPYRYRGYRFDTETGLYYLQSRYYDAAVGRFVNTDELVILEYLFSDQLFSTSIFGYCSGNPIMKQDPMGYIAIADDLVVLGVCLVVAIVLIACLYVYINNRPSYQVSGYNFQIWMKERLAIAIYIPLSIYVYVINSSQSLVVSRADAKVRSTVKNNSPYQYWSATLGRGCVDIGRPLTFSDALLEVKSGKSVFTVTRALAYSLALAAGGGRPPTTSENHRVGIIGYYWHFHPYGHTSAHIWYLF